MSSRRTGGNGDPPSGGRRRGLAWLAPVAAASLVLAGCSTAASGSGTSALPTGRRVAYVGSGSGWVPFNLVTHSVSRAIPFSWRGSAAVVAPDGRTAYATTDSGIVSVNLVTGTLGKIIFKGDFCSSIALGNQGRTLYLADCGDGPGIPTSILPVDVKTGVAGAPIEVPGGPVGIFIAPNGRTTYALTNGDATLTPVDLATGMTGSVITVPEGVDEMAFTPDGTMAYATGSSDDVVDGKQYSYVTPINLMTGVPEQPIALLHDPYGIVVSPDGRTAYVTGGNVPIGSVGPPTPPDVTSINLASGRIGATYSIPGGAGTIFNVTSAA